MTGLAKTCNATKRSVMDVNRDLDDNDQAQYMIDVISMTMTNVNKSNLSRNGEAWKRVNKLSKMATLN